jgi:hypothetical protein
MPQANLEADPLFQLLTDALRAGPGSPEWHQAVTRLRDGGMKDADEYKLLVSVREHLESGRDYRSVRPGPGFTRKLLGRLDEEGGPGARRRGLPTATLVAIVSGVVLLAVVVVVGVQLFNRGPVDTPPAKIVDLERSFFPTEVAQATFEGPSASVPPGWKQIGQWPLEATPAGLHPQPTTAPAAAIGGALVAPEGIPADEPFAAEVTLQLQKPSDDVIVEFFVSADDNFSPDRATSGNELVWLLRGLRQRVVLGEEAKQQADVPRPRVRGDRGEMNRELTVRILVNRDVAIVESNKQRLWAGPHGLPAKPRQVGVRFLHPAGAPKTPDPAIVQSIKVFKK